MDHIKFVKSLLETSSPLSITSTLVLPTDDSSTKASLSLLLGLDSNHLNRNGKLIFEHLESDEKYFYSEVYDSLKGKINALLTIQDIYPGTIYDEKSLDSMNKSMYFYYESIHLLREYFYCGFNNLPSAGLSIARTILEFSIRQCYFYKVCDSAKSYNPLECYFKSEEISSTQRQLNKILSKGSFEAPIRKMIQDTLVDLSKGGSHAYVPKHSSLDEFKINHKYTLSSLYFWVEMNHILTACLWCYYYTFPMLFAPVNILKKFGFSPPLGIFISDRQHLTIKNSMEKDDYDIFLKRSLSLEEVKGNLEWYDSLPNMNRQKIKKSWSEDSNFPGFDLGIINIITKQRALRELLTQTSVAKHKISVFDIPEDFELPEMSNLAYWKDKV